MLITNDPLAERLIGTMTDAELTRVLLPRQPIDAVETNGSPGAAVAVAMLDPAYQLK